MKQTPPEQELYDHALAEIQAVIAGEDFSSAWNLGSAFMPDHLAAFVLCLGEVSRR